MSFARPPMAADSMEPPNGGPESQQITSPPPGDHGGVASGRPKSMSLREAAVGRDNNFSLLRLLAAWAVLASHSFVIVTGDPKNEPLGRWLGVSPGSLAVDVFFVTSGFLITSSLLSRASLLRFAIARLLRIYPALIVMVALSALTLGSFFSRLDLPTFAMHEQTFQYVIRNSTLFWGTRGALPDVFTDVPLPRVINGSLWTLPFEVRMYLMLTVIWCASLVCGRGRLRGFRAATVVIAISLLTLHLYTALVIGVVDQRWRLGYMFFAGAAIYMVRDHVLLSARAFTVCAAVVLASTVDRSAFTAAYSVLVGYLILWLAYVPRGAIRQFNRAGDYSYGTYIWAFPVQQGVISLQPSLSIGEHIVASTILTLLFAVLSWHLVERPALALAKRRAQVQSPGAAEPVTSST